MRQVHRATEIVGVEVQILQGSRQLRQVHRAIEVIAVEVQPRQLARQQRQVDLAMKVVGTQIELPQVVWQLRKVHGAGEWCIEVQGDIRNHSGLRASDALPRAHRRCAAPRRRRRNDARCQRRQREHVVVTCTAHGKRGGAVDTRNETRHRRHSETKAIGKRGYAAVLCRPAVIATRLCIRNARIFHDDRACHGNAGDRPTHALRRGTLHGSVGVRRRRDRTEDRDGTGDDYRPRNGAPRPHLS
mmetsp:Transcript_31445/g.97140  ORF Transcript_31445/g.97140 Transcript_31445/m.97140 type:complete len:244 (-) Transcript_31445:96-827(-)